jgi:hypothetical protein
MTTTDPVQMIRDAAQNARENFESEAKSLSRKVAKHYQLDGGDVESYVESYEMLGVFEQATGFLDEHGGIDLDRVRKWNQRMVVGFRGRGHGVALMHREANHKAQLALMSVLSGEW